MKKFYSLISALVLGIGAMCAQEQPLNVTFTTPGDMEGWSMATTGATGIVADGHLNVTMTLYGTTYRADIQWGDNKNANPIEFTADVQYLAVKFIGTRPHGNMTLEVANGSNTCTYSNTPTGSVVTPANNTIYYYQLDKNANYVTPYDARRITFKIADCKEEPYSYSIDWIKTFASVADIEAAASLADDGDTDYEEVSVYNQTTKVSYGNLVEAWKAAVTGDVLTLHKDATVTERLNSESRDITIQGNGHTIYRGASWKALLFLTNQKDKQPAGSITLEDLTIDGANIDVTGQTIEAGNGGRVYLTNVNVVNCLTNNPQGVICAKTNGGITANNLTIKDCSVPEGCGDMFAGSNTVELTGYCSFSLFLQGNIYAKDQGVNGGAVTVMFTLDGNYARNLDAQAITGTTNNTYYPCGVSGYTLAPKNGNLYIQEATQDGIAAIEAEAADVTVYNLQGIVVRENVAAAEALVGLPAGLYIVNGKKIMVK